MAKMTTLCYLEQNGSYLMLHRIRKKEDENRGKWIGVGGKFEEGESPEQCLRREVLEETGLTVDEARFRGIVTFVSDEYGTEYMHLFTCDAFHGTLRDCSEGELAWIPKDKIGDLNLWEGDRVFLKLLAEGKGFFSLRLSYRGDSLAEVSLEQY